MKTQEFTATTTSVEFLFTVYESRLPISYFNSEKRVLLTSMCQNKNSRVKHTSLSETVYHDHFEKV